MLAKAVEQITEYLEGRRTTFDLPLDLQGTAFQKVERLALVEKLTLKVPMHEYRACGLHCRRYLMEIPPPTASLQSASREDLQGQVMIVLMFVCSSLNVQSTGLWGQPTPRIPYLYAYLVTE